MRADRRTLLAAAAGVAAGCARGAGPPRIRAVAFDAFPIFDPRPIQALAEQSFPGHGAALAAAWRSRQFEYAWLRTLMGRYADFWQVTREALVDAGRALQLELADTTRERLMHAWLELAPWPDVLPALTALREAGVRMAFLSNFTGAMLDAGVRRGGLRDFFEPHLSTDRVGAFKPDTRAYAMATDAFGLPREQIAFAAFAAWDAAGAKAFGYPTFWVNRLGAPPDTLGIGPDAAGAGLADLVAFVRRT